MFVTRFAPAPTGYLHLGHVANALFVWGEAAAANGQVLLRIEDHDRQRCRPEFEAAVLDDLDWLGFVPDLYPTAAFRRGHCESRQSDRHHVYLQAAERLAARGLVYGCACSRQIIQQRNAATGRPPVSDGDLFYPGICRTRKLPLTDAVGWRLRMPADTVTFTDRWCGPQTQTPADQCGDVLIRDRHGNWTYQWVAAVDDHLQGVTDVIRGTDLLASTGRQILLGQLLGRPVPARFAHHALIMKSPTQKLSKSDHDTGVHDLRRAGWAPAEVLAEAGRRCARPSSSPLQ